MRLIAAIAMALFLPSCGDEGGATPGFVGPCGTSAAAVVGCGAGTTLQVEPAAQLTVTEACDKLVRCGILGADRTVGDDPPRHQLDHRWCVDRMSVPSSIGHPCSEARFRETDVSGILRCMGNTTCTALGLPLTEKFRGGDEAPQLDRFDCDDGSSIQDRHHLRSGFTPLLMAILFAKQLSRLALVCVLLCAARASAAEPTDKGTQASDDKASSAEAQQLLTILQGKPSGMSMDDWRARRREVARELGELRERAAVPTLLNIIKRERFDVILEISIGALANIGDERAIKPLKRLLTDPTVDTFVRDAAAQALRRLGDRSSSATSQREADSAQATIRRRSHRAGPREACSQSASRVRQPAPSPPGTLTQRPHRSG